MLDPSCIYKAKQERLKLIKLSRKMGILPKAKDETDTESYKFKLDENMRFYEL